MNIPKREPKENNAAVNTERAAQENKEPSLYDMSYKPHSNTVKPQNFTPPPQKQQNFIEKNEIPKQIKPEKRKVSSINVLLVLGALLIILAGFIFATTTWEILGNGIKAVIILSISAVFFAVSSLAERKLELPKTGIVFYSLGSVFLPITVIAVGYFKLFGEWFSLSGDGGYAVIAVATSLLATVCIKGSFDYHHKGFTWCSLMSITATFMYVIGLLTDRPDFMALWAAVYSLVVIVLCKIAVKYGVKSEAFAHIIPILPQFQMVNTIFLSITAIIVSATWLEHTVVVTLACGLFAAAYIFGSFSEKNGFGGALPFLLFLSFAFFYGFSPDSFSEGTYVIAAISTVVTVLSLLGVMPEKLLHAFRILSAICVTISAGALGIAVISSEITVVSVIVFALLSAEILALGIIRRNDINGKIMLAVFSFALPATLLSALRLIFERDFAFRNAAIVTMLVLSAAYVAADVILSKKGRAFILRSVVSDVMFSTFTATVLIIQSYECNKFVISLPALIVICAAAVQLIHAFFPKKDWERFVFMFTAVISLSAFATDDKLITAFGEPAVFTVISAVLLVLTIILMIFKKDSLAENGALTGLFVITSIFIIGLGDPIWQFWLILAAALTVKGWLRQRKAPLCAAIILFCVSFSSAAYDLFGLDEDAGILFAGGFAALLSAALLFVPQNELVVFCRKVSFYCLDALTFILICMISSTGKTSFAISAGAAVILAMTLTSGYMLKKTVWLIAPLSAIYFAVANQLDMYLIEVDNCSVVTGITIAAMILMSIGASYLLHRNRIAERTSEGLCLDSFAISRLAGLAAYFGYSYIEMQSWLGIWLIGASVTSLLRREHKPTSNRVIIAVSLLTPVFAWMLRPFADAPDGYALEINIIPVLLYLAALRLLKWDKKYLDHATFITYTVVYVILFFHALNGSIGNALIVMISALAMLVLSFFIKMKRWFILSVTVITTSAVFMSIKLWGSPAWWVYLLAAGIILIAVGAFNEMKKKSADNNFTGKLSRFMSEWTW
ncbi:MAG: hypothetical protein ACI4I1_05220 [Oscillospiraceae bacterium]